MIDGLKLCPEHKASGSAPAFAVRSDWPVVRFWRVARLRSEKNRPDLPLLSVFLGRGVIPYAEGGGQVHKPGLDLSVYQVVREGDLVMNNQQAWRGSVGVSRHTGIISPAYVVLALDASLNPRFADHLFQSRVMVAQNVTSSKGVGDIQRDIHIPWLKNARVPVPPLDEQAAIVRFLDHAGAKIERAVRAKRKLIALLNEQKQVIVHRAVTRGLDSAVKLKPSGVAWLGDVPEHWETPPLKSVCTIQSGITLGKFYIGEQVSEFPYLRVANVQAGRLNLSNVKTLRVPQADAVRALLRVGDVLMTEGGDPDKLGRGCVWNGEISPCIHQNHIFAVRPLLARLKPHFLATLLASHYAQTYFLRTAKQTTNLASTNKTTIGQFRVLLPPVVEQEAILRGLEVELSPMHDAISRAEREVALLREYRTTLTANVVTGKLDVRDVAKRLPTTGETLPLGDESFGEGLNEEEVEVA